ncbi:MAG: Gfo/Idh/MocA family oxidoreductase [Lentisphaerae bacterium]|jgi:myo-inositol 2-dehydrogenase / D-chiro-inositol 1-dehydrogenase|nr:Gfo/Idh/MocA family oxidoreductase [Lentisphaerota bacterium]MBT4814101.1 Gfo/Idh/MocA family oxidoreductase [Lentisphaerota bacterium]MBT5604575.1 Gfo/Idh/MocA family oxidoreductase [Lentisphaerota bacterium]MBT7061748.1 Gfo/Idh/MocA family oxidoreductase [Lentisphaerota bacterium]MBT7848794.1 Gfo/Idh/MocA family oxidoreductase [Lentisphaerota bacterium]
MDHVFSRRDVIKAVAAAGAAVPVFSIPSAAARPTGKVFKVALVGCGGRGRGALKNCIDAGKHLGITIRPVAVADVFADRASKMATTYSVLPERVFVGFSGYRDVMETEADIVLMATPPNFRPLHLEAAINAGKHVFMEKPVAVDPPGARRVIAAGELAAKKGLGIVAGTQRRHQAAYRRNAHAIANGAIGQIVGGTVLWCSGRLWYRERRPQDSDAEYMVRNWLNFNEMSGDHIVEQHVHNIDVANWFIGHPPNMAIGFGGRARRITGNQFDFFSIDFDYGDGCHIHSMCRQVNGCYTRVSEFFTGTEGQTWGNGRLKSTNDKEIEIPEFPEHGGPYVQEHTDLMQSILDGKPLNEARRVAESTLTAIMGRISAYTGQLVRWRDLTENKKSPFYSRALTPTAEDFESGSVKAPEDDVIWTPGKA